jgi:hypothetical protein
MSGFISEDEHEIHSLFTLTREELLIETSKLRGEERKLKGKCIEYLQIIKDTQRKLNEFEALYHSKIGINKSNHYHYLIHYLIHSLILYHYHYLIHYFNHYLINYVILCHYHYLNLYHYQYLILYLILSQFISLS